MGNTPAHHKRRLSGDGDYRFSSATPTYLSVTIPPSKRRNMHSLTDLSKSAPPDYSENSCESGPAMVAHLLREDCEGLDEATSMLRAASLRDSIKQARPCPELSTSSPAPSLNMGPPMTVTKDDMAAFSGGHNAYEKRPASTGCPSPFENRHTLDINGSTNARQRARTSPSTSAVLRSYQNQQKQEKSLPQQNPAKEDESGERKCPTVFRWNGGGRDIYISGTFNNWETRIPMVKRSSGVYVIIDCTPGTHEYKYFIDGAWYHDPTKPTVDNIMGTKNNIVHVKPSDFDVIQALELDQANSKHRPNQMDSADLESMGHSPPGDYGRYIPSHPSELQRRPNEYRPVGPIAPGVGSINQPPLLPPHLLQGIMNMDTGVHCDPNLLPQPNHVIVNHLYALSIKDGVIVLSVITRYRQKFVSTVFYRPIQD
ncbi:5'-AMP-activated protein kinase subunit beta-2 [Fasciola gigantica]|uniref:5'-AMP-activated protein kinase subunit beta-1 n=1 Tax=Fasciola gigantica TaxID=46835 RepID=A0A504YD59_FASGI|nr:5'-AMP-activated protein kinase subunit beta-2 [Fasciola gigantica]